MRRFENGGRLYLLDLKTEQYHEVNIQVVTDRATLKPRLENVSGLIQGVHVSPTGKRAVVEARGDLFTVPAENGVIRNLTRSSGVAERFPVWSPDGKYLFFRPGRTSDPTYSELDDSWIYANTQSVTPTCRQSRANWSIAAYRAWAPAVLIFLLPFFETCRYTMTTRFGLFLAEMRRDVCLTSKLYNM